MFLQKAELSEAATLINKLDYEAVADIAGGSVRFL